MISESDKALFRSVVENNVPVNKDKTTPQDSAKKKAFKAYTYITHGGLSGSVIISYAQNGV